MGKESFATRKPFRFDEELIKSGMCAIYPVRCESELEVSSQLQPARFARDVDQSDAPDFDVVFCGQANAILELRDPP